jgi:thiamine monophosphate synthase
VSAVEGTSCLVLINGDVDAAVESGAHGVHLPERFLEDIPQVQQDNCETFDQGNQSGAVRLGGRE